MKAAIASSEAAYYSIDSRLGTIRFDSRLALMLGQDPDRLTMSTADFLSHFQDAERFKLMDGFRRVQMQNEPFRLTIPYTINGADTMWFEASGSRLSTDEYSHGHCVGLWRDVSSEVRRLKAAESNARNAQVADHRKSQFVSQVSHEIRTPLTAIAGCIDSLLLSIPEGDARDVLRVMRAQGQVLKSIANDVLDLSRMEAGKLVVSRRDCELTAILAQVCSLMNPLAQEKGIDLTWRAETKLPKVFRCDSDRLRQILINLVGNAIKFTDDGSVAILVSVQESEGIGELRIVVRDSGVGIPRTMLEQVFREFVRGDHQRAGAGLGLPIAKRLCELLGGSIAVCSEVGLGSAFAVTLPLGDLADYTLVQSDRLVALQAGMIDQTSCEQVFDIRVLAAEDTPAVQFVLERVVGTMVAHLDIVADGRQAVCQAMEKEATQDAYDVLLMDIKMPVVGGLEAAGQLRREGFSKPIVALSAGAMEADREMCLAAGCSHFIAKPIDRSELKRVFELVHGASLKVRS